MGKVLSLVWTRYLPAWGADLRLTVEWEEWECWGGWDGLEWCTCPDLVIHTPCDLRWNTGCFSLKPICFLPTYCVSPQKSLPWKNKGLVLSLISHASCLVSLSTSFPSENHICPRPTESTSKISALASLDLGIFRELEGGNESRRWCNEVSKEIDRKNENQCIIPGYQMGMWRKGRSRTFRKEFSS